MSVHAVGGTRTVCAAVGVIAMLLAVGSPLSAQSPVRSSGSPDAGGPNLPAERLGVNDLLAVSVYNAPELSRTIRVAAEGDIRLPMLKQPVKAEGFLPSEVESAIVQALKTEGLLVNPIVTVTVAEYASRPISIIGAVKRPQTFQAVGPVTLLEALARAEGLVAGTAGHEILVTRRERSEDGAVTMVTRRIPVKGLVDDADPQFNVPLHGGEEIRVPELGKVYVIGNVKKPGAFPIPDGGQATVLQLLALSEGLLPYSSNDAYIYRRDGPPSKGLVIDVKKVLARQTPDVPLAANDILYIPDAHGRKTSAAVLGKVAGFAAATLSGILIYSVLR